MSPQHRFVCFVALLLLLQLTHAGAARVGVTGNNTDLEHLLKLTARCTNKPPTWNPYSPPCQWEGATCDSNGNVNDFSDFEQDPPVGGYLDLRYLPVNLQALEWQGEPFLGTLDLTVFPASIEQITLSGNWSGTVDLTHLPPTLYNFDLNGNPGLSGTVDLTKLPYAQLATLDLSHCAFSGSVDLRYLPQSMSGGDLNLQNNNFDGTLDLNALPGLTNVWLSNNAFSGTLDISSLAISVQTLDVSYNQLSGTLNLTTTDNQASLQVLFLNNNQFSGVLDLSVMPLSVHTLDVSNNLLHTVNLTNLQNGNFKVLSLANNSLTGTVDFVHFPNPIYNPDSDQITNYIDLSNNNFCGTSTIPSGSNAATLCAGGRIGFENACPGVQWSCGNGSDGYMTCPPCP